MNQHLAKAIAIYEQEGIDFQQLLTWHLCHGIVVCDMDCFAMGFSVFRENPTQAVHVDDGDTLFVTFTTGNMRPAALHKYTQDYDFIAFQRSFKGSDRVRVHDMYKFYSKLEES
jgi:hypothetical protein